MRSHTFMRRVTLVAGTAVVAGTLTACGLATPKPEPGPTTPAPSPSARESTPPVEDSTVYGQLAVRIEKVGSAAVLPAGPIDYTLIVTPSSGGLSTEVPVARDGTFAISLPPGAYDVSTVDVRATDLGAEPVHLPLTTNEMLHFTQPADGCAYGGKVSVLYGRLPAGDMNRQTAIIGQLQQATKRDYAFVFLPSGGFVVTGGEISLDAPRPAAAQNCQEAEFESVPRR